ncbi:c2H2 type zinc-finger (2 copies) domain-containing protein [Sarocladium implicatum]|nr:c2H2 type zinc-finger (2 copies) domain-containing protein [Sarocladium implicatum]
MITNVHDTNDTTNTYSLPIMTETMTTGVTADQLPTVAQAPSLCRLCDLELSNGQTFRTHIKSDQQSVYPAFFLIHAGLTLDFSVYNLRLKVSQADEKTSPPTPPTSDSPRAKNTASSSPSRRVSAPTATVEEEYGEETGDDGEDEGEDEVEEYVPGECLFCPEFFDELDPSLAHMTTAHGFTVPFQDCLAVDIELVLDYMHFVINGYMECICCGTQRGTVAAVQQHMMAKGHCRFDINDETADFFAVPKEDTSFLQKTQQRGDATVRLPSGKIISHRTIQEPQEPKSRQARSNPVLEAITSGTATASNTDRPSHQKSAEQHHHGSNEHTHSSHEIVRREDRREDGDRRMVRSSEAILAAQLSRLVVRGEMAQLRVESKKKAKMERKNNKILQKHFKVDAGDSRAGRQFRF